MTQSPSVKLSGSHDQMQKKLASFSVRAVFKSVPRKGKGIEPAFAVYTICAADHCAQ